MPQLLEAQNPRDDWTGMINTSERRKRQNRLNQRAYRIRDVAATTVLPEGYLLLHTAESRAKVQIFAQRVYQDYSSGLPQPGYLHVLIRLNVLNALAQNAALLEFRFKGLCFPELVSPFNQHGPSSVHTFIPSQAYPSWLQPTALQMTVRHHPWIDLIPIPRMRDNILCALEAGFLDNKELGIDILGVEDIQGDTASLIIWGEPWDPRGWEVSISFLRKWGWLIAGCPVVIEATNFWRHKRGEKDLDFEVVSKLVGI
ncbi:hypothetical protein BGZ61DRAFT_500175 [Ilyonectria robusta]|uniref:uncharacterized protein n=1 Tax=Ilyonectria robusta TaxID=1079257 RepID=UPI001E8EED6F|nr:uncharacterized protein BGZ61DRAFT_500175 [Ilyonectria robusta]KAH8656816.1 hypothetical protein BGZ61DRAFT_500175 [Ilyonectria robusta]